MLRSLDIRDMLIIDRLEIELRPGLNVLTGETGAGKSILLDALGFVLGWRGRADLVRAGASQGEVTAVFDLAPDHPAREVLGAAGLPISDELIVRRVNTADGRKTAWVNDRRTSGDVLRQLSDALVELHGQHDDRGLLNPRGHRAMLDAYAGLDGELAATRTAWRRLRAAREAHDLAAAALEAARAEEAFLRHAAAEFDALEPQPGEEDALDARRRAIKSAARIREDVARAAQALGPDGAEGRMIDGIRWLDGAAAAAEGRLDGALDALERAMTELGEAQAVVDGAFDELDFDSGELERVEERLFAIRALARKHGVPADELPDLVAEMRQKLQAVEGGEADLADLAAHVRSAETAYAEAAKTLGEARRGAAVRLDAAMAAELAPLKMERAVFSTSIGAADPGPEGCDTVSFTVATNPGAPAGPLDRIASGGELSRFLLALKVCLTSQSDRSTIIFDEIDRGVGGATAAAVGRRLSALADTAQVLAVTHSPQVAALGHHHWRVEKRVEGGVTLSSVVALGKAQRVDELARMLAGDTVTDEARGAARALLSG